MSLRHVLSGLLVATAFLSACDQAPPAVRASPADPVTSHLDARAAERTGQHAEPPTEVRLPSGALVPVRPADTRPDGLLGVPADVRRSGWWRGGSRLGDPFGSTLLAGHVDSATQGLGPYAELLTVRPGDRLTLGSAHLRQVFAVASLRLVPQGSLRDNREVYAVDGPRRLTLVTCAPPYRPAAGGYLNLAVVTALPVGRPQRRGPS